MCESNHDVGHLDAGVVNVVLDINGVPRSAQQADKSIAEDGVAEMADVRSLVGVDAGVLDQDLSAYGGSAFAGVIGGRECGAEGKGARGIVALEAGVHVSGAGNFKLLEALGQRHFGDDFFGNLAGRLTKLFRQLKGEWQGELTHLDFGRLVDHDVGQINVVLLTEELAKVLGQLLLPFQVHEGSG